MQDFIKNAPMQAATLTDEPLIVPMTPGSAIMRLTQAAGAIKRHASIAGVLPTDAAAQLEQYRAALLATIEAGDYGAIEPAFRAAQQHISRLYETLCQPGLWGANEAAANFAALGFPDPLQIEIQSINVTTVLPTFARPRAQVLTNLSFQPAAGATGYWLFEVRYFDGQRVEDAVIGSTSPYFSRIRLDCGTRHLRIESRNPSSWARSDEFKIEVPFVDAWGE